MFKILVCGGRDFGNLKELVDNGKKKFYRMKTGQALIRAKAEREFTFDTLDEIYPEYASDKNLKIIAGGAPGTDDNAIVWAMVNGFDYKVYEADWKQHKKAAGPIRNQLMLDSEVEYNQYNQIDNFIVVAFPGGTGTADMVRRAEKLGIEIKRIKYDAKIPGT